uniref:Putative secreted peptide n=1 Tax=Anopheles braziliensis TaxID=58242 RepID=A0A2M3ZUE9_9DIPT
MMMLMMLVMRMMMGTIVIGIIATTTTAAAIVPSVFIRQCRAEIIESKVTVVGVVMQLLLLLLVRSCGHFNC